MSQQPALLHHLLHLAQLQPMGCLNRQHQGCLRPMWVQQQVLHQSWGLGRPLQPLLGAGWQNRSWLLLV